MTQTGTALPCRQKTVRRDNSDSAPGMPHATIRPAGAPTDERSANPKTRFAIVSRHPARRHSACPLPGFHPGRAIPWDRFRSAIQTGKKSPAGSGCRSLQSWYRVESSGRLLKTTYKPVWRTGRASASCVRESRFVRAGSPGYAHGPRPRRSEHWRILPVRRPPPGALLESIGERSARLASFGGRTEMDVAKAVVKIRREAIDAAGSVGPGSTVQVPCPNPQTGCPRRDRAAVIPARRRCRGTSALPSRLRQKGMSAILS